MDKPRLLSGDELVVRGTTKTDATLPEVGLKEVIPNGSWLEQKQIQSALEARKHLIEVERIEKCGTLSHAEWREELMMAEVSQKAGSYWQFLGHNVGKRLYLNPDEALYLMEVNCLQLKYNEVTVSLQQAYSLLLRSRISVLEYKVFASLSRLGYKVIRHEESKLTEYEKKLNLTSNSNHLVSKENEKVDGNEERIIENNGLVVEIDCKTNEQNNKTQEEEIHTAMEIDDNINVLKEPDKGEDTGNQSINENKMDTDVIERPNEKVECGKEWILERSPGEHPNCKDNANQTENETMEINEGRSLNESEATTTETEIVKPTNSNTDVIKIAESSKSKLQKLEKRKLIPSNTKDIDRHFELVPDLLQKQTVTIKVPDQKHIPQNVFLNKLSYVLNIESIKSRTESVMSESRPYSAEDTVNGDHVRRVRDSYENYPGRSNWNHSFSNERFMGQFPQYRPFHFWRPFNLLFQRPFLPTLNYVPRFNFVRPPPLIGYTSNQNFNVNNNNGNMQNCRKRPHASEKEYHFGTIKKLTERLKMKCAARNLQMRNMDALQKVVHTYNLRYKTRLIINDQWEVVAEPVVIDTIELDEDEGTISKKLRLEAEESDNLNSLKQLALELKKLYENNKATSRHRRAFANVLKRFNETYNKDLYLSKDYEILDKRYITLDSSSDSDCVIEETPKSPMGKKLRNPFNILKRLSEKPNSSISIPSTSSKNINEITKSIDEIPKEEDTKYKEFFLMTFGENWRPHEEDFGRAEVTPRNGMFNRLMDDKKEEYLYEFMKTQPYDFENWLDLKYSFYKNIEESATIAQRESADSENSRSNCIIGPQDCTDTASVMKKLNIIKCCKTSAEGESSLRIDFDVYNRDVQNFRKSNRPKPLFRVACMNESTSFPSGSDIAALHAKYDDNVVILFAVVSVGSISYLQINPTDLPVYTPSNDLT